jgi:hypothetical protein
MSHKLINHSPDIQSLRNEGFEIEIRDNHILVSNVPYLDASNNLKHGTLVSDVTIANNRVSRPSNHVIYFSGDFPCDGNRKQIQQLAHSSQTRNLGSNITVNHSFSNKPPAGYSNYYEKVTSYVRVISAPAIFLYPEATAQTYTVVESIEEESVLNYSDTNSSKSNLNLINQKLSGQKIGIIGLGGTGSYVLDFISKTLVSEIHLFDGDEFLQHNAFRAPGASSLEELGKKFSKVDYYCARYSNMRKNIFPHNSFISDENVGSLNGLDFVFICIDRSEIKQMIFEKLEKENISFIDTGVGLKRVDDSILGSIRTTASFGEARSHIWDNSTVSFADDENPEYSTNIQIAEINALNAAIAVVRWKQLVGFYCDAGKNVNSVFDIFTNSIVRNETAT